MDIGRIDIFTDVPRVTADNILSVLTDALIAHAKNVQRETYLLEYESGEQPLKRRKTYRKDINCKCVDNVANEITEFKRSYVWGCPITFSQRGEKDSGNIEKEAEAIALLNEQYEAIGINSRRQEVARFLEISGLGYTYVDVNDDWQTDGDSLFNVVALDPRFAFVVKSNYYIDRRPVMGVTFRITEDGAAHYTCFTPDSRYDILDANKIQYIVKNRLGMIPIIEWFRDYDRMGCFERQISEMDNLNLLISDMSNGIDQSIQCVWHGNDVEFPLDPATGKPKNPKSNEWVLTETTSDGKQPFIKPLSIDYDYGGMLQNIVTRRTMILQKCNVPQRNDNSGGSTGVAMDDATGWSAAEASAAKQQNIIEACMMQEVRCVLAAIKANSHTPVGSPLLSLRLSDVQPNIKRQKTYEMTVKSNAFATLVSHGVDGLHALKSINYFDDVNQVWADSKEGIEKYQKSVYEKGRSTYQRYNGWGYSTRDTTQIAPNADRLSPDESDQIENSPNIDKG